MIDPKVKYVAHGRHAATAKFHNLSDISFRTFTEAQYCADRWLELTMKGGHRGAEIMIVTEELPYIASCISCNSPLFKDDVVFKVFGDIYCIDCADRRPDTKGFFDLLDIPKNNSKFSLDSGI